MKKYIVTIKEMLIKNVEIDAKDLEDANIKARVLLDDIDMNKNMDGYDRFIDEIKEINRYE